MKKLITIILSLSLMLSMASVTAFAKTITSVTNGSNTASKAVTASYYPNKTATYSVDIAWGAMTFNYTPDTHVWNPATLTYDDSVTGSWTPTAGGANIITVTNRSNTPITARLSYEPGTLYGEAAAMFGGGSAIANLDLNSADSGGATGTGTATSASTDLSFRSNNFTGKTLNSTQIGSVTVTILPQD